MELAALPTELLVQIAADPGLSTDDVRAFRLVGRAFAPVGAQVLFRRVHLSKFYRDREAFLGIAASPHLAPIPVELVWYELADDEEGICDVEENLKYTLRAGICDATWCPVGRPAENEPSDSAAAPCGAELDAINEFLPLFFEALEAMSAVHTFVSRPFPQQRLFASHDCFEMPAYLLRSSTSSQIRHPNNNGLFRFLLPAMARPGSRITRLHWADEVPRPSFVRLQESHVDAFRAMTAVDLCISHPESPAVNVWSTNLSRIPPVAQESIDRLAACLRRAVGLRTLSLCFENGAELVEGNGRSNSNLLRALLFDGRPRWVNLTALYITDAVPSEAGLLDFLASHAPNLRHLAFSACDITRATVLEIARIPRLQLSSFVVRPEKDADEVEIISERWLVDFVNKKRADCPITWGKFFLTEAALVWDPHDWTAVAHFDMGSSHRYMYDEKDVSFVDKWVEDLDMAEAAAVEEEGNEDASSDSSFIQGLEVNGYRTGRACLNFTPREFQAADIRQERRHLSSPRWKWARRGARIVYWKSQDEAGHATSMWRFTRKHPDGSISEACGEDPIEYWSDWDSEAGDGAERMTAEAIPYGEALGRFVLDADGKGFDIPEDTTIMEYDDETDPFDYDGLVEEY